MNSDDPEVKNHKEAIKYFKEFVKIYENKKKWRFEVAYAAVKIEELETLIS